MRVASDEAIRRAAELRASGKSWDELTSTPESWKASIELWLGSPPAAKRKR